MCEWHKTKTEHSFSLLSAGKSYAQSFYYYFTCSLNPTLMPTDKGWSL